MARCSRSSRRRRSPRRASSSAPPRPIPATLASLERLGFTNPQAAIAAIRAWQSGRYAATRSARARERLIEFLPFLLEAFSHTAEPDLALATFDKVIAEMPAGVQLFSLLAANPSLLRLIADIMGTAPRLARIIGRRPRLLDAVLDPGFFGTVPTPAKLKELVGNALAQASDYQDALDRARIVGREQGFLIGVRVISGTLSARQSGAAYTSLAETLIEATASRVEAELVRQHGRLPGGQAAIIAMGKLGGREMTAGSDLDLIIVYDYEGEEAHSDGRKALAGAAILHALHPAPHRRAVGRHGRRLALPGRHAAQALRQSGPGRDQAVELRQLSEGLGLDLGASRADTGERRHRPCRAPPANQCDDQGGAGAIARPRRCRGRCQVDAGEDRGREGERGHVGPEAGEGRADRSRVHRPVLADRERRRTPRRSRSEHRACACPSSRLPACLRRATPRFWCPRRGSTTR